MAAKEAVDAKTAKEKIADPDEDMLVDLFAVAGIFDNGVAIVSLDNVRFCRLDRP